MNPWKPYPLIRLLIPFLGGVIYALIESGWQFEISWLIVVLGSLTIVLLLLTLFHNLSFRTRWMPGLTIFLLMIILGIVTVQSNKAELIGSKELAWGSSRYQIFPAEILEPPGNSSRSVRLIVRRYEVDTLRKLLIKREKVSLFLEKDTNSLDLQFGDWLIVSTSLKPVRDESNPYGFDPAAYYGRIGVFSQGWVKSTDWKPTHLSKSYLIRRWAFTLRDRMMNILRENSLKGEEFAIASAILLGYTGEIGQDLRKGFAATGAMHVLAVSGMHVGVIFLFLERLLAFLKRRRFGTMIRAILMIFIIWCYAMVTGLSPPVFRAALMLSMIIVGGTFKRKTDSLNIVGASMLVMLLIDPSLLLHLGFQFSYLAVFGILILYKPVYQLFPAVGWVARKVWGLIAVSIAAQLATFPIALYTFHQFPNYFLLTNLLILPLASFVIYSGIGVLALSPVPVLSALLAKVLTIIVAILNSIIRFIENLPGSTSTGFYPSLPEILILYLGIAVVCSFLFTRKTIWVYTLLVLIIMWSIMNGSRDYKRTNRSVIVIFQVKGASQYTFVKGNAALTIKDYKASCNEPFAQEVLSMYLLAEGITTAQTTYLTDNHFQGADDLREFGFFARKGSFLQFADQRIAIFSSELPYVLSDSLHVDIVILRNNPSVSIERIVQTFSPHQIVIDPTNSWYNTRKWREQASGLGVPCYNVMEEGAYILDVGY